MTNAELCKEPLDTKKAYIERYYGTSASRANRLRSNNLMNIFLCDVLIEYADDLENGIDTALAIDDMTTLWYLSKFTREEVCRMLVEKTHPIVEPSLKTISYIARHVYRCGCCFENEILTPLSVILLDDKSYLSEKLAQHNLHFIEQLMEYKPEEIRYMLSLGAEDIQELKELLRGYGCGEWGDISPCARMMQNAIDEKF